MSLAHIRRIREAHGKPGIVSVIIGPAPAWLADDPIVVHIGERADLRTLDWLPLVGLWVTVHHTDDNHDRALAVADCLERAGAKLFGFASKHGAHALTADKTPEQVQAIRREWELLCPA